MNDSKQWMVEIRHVRDEFPPKIMGPYPQARADRIADGAAINLDWENWTVGVKEAS